MRAARRIETFVALAALVTACASPAPQPAAVAIETTTPPEDTDRFEPASGVACRRSASLCEWRGGPSAGLTRLFFGDAAGDAVESQVADAHFPNDPIFKPNPDASCDTLVTTCYDQGGASDTLTSRYFGSEALTRLTDRRAQVVRYGAHVTCDQRTQICFDRFGAGVGITQLYIGSAEADALLARLRARDR